LHAAEQHDMLLSRAISKFIGMYQSMTVDNKFDILQKMRCSVSFTIDCDNPSFLLSKGKCHIPWSSKFFMKNKLKEFIMNLNFLVYHLV